MTNPATKRCPWCEQADDYRAYHDEQWGRPVADPVELFAKLCLDGQQAGLSWLTILRKQTAYEQAFYHFDPAKIQAMPSSERANLYDNPGIIRNRKKIDAIFANASAYLAMQDRGLEFSHWLWQFVGGRPVINAYQAMADVPTENAASRAMAKALKQQGFKFVGPTICYAFMQAVGMMNDHLVDCHCYMSVCQQMRQFSLTG
ncbi:DNA-3-methyladenine glycosylase I [Idiomarina seosinensis]|uniref:DNA-3-methyladenine glycosylase I n=1 Tax=Idiomarina seosinensis TaxID=281739 RepID=UPI00384ADB8F